MSFRNRSKRLLSTYKTDGARETVRVGRRGIQHLLLVDTYKKHGPREALRIAWDGMRYSGQSRKILVVLSEPKALPRTIEAAKDHKFVFASQQDLEKLAGTPAYSITPTDIERVSTNTARCLLQLDGDKLAGYAWIWNSRLAYIEDVEDGVHVDGVHINLPDDTIYNYKAYTNPDYRGYGYQALRHLELLKQTEAEGVKRLFGYVDHFNSNSLKGVRKSGYVPVGELRVRHKKDRATMILDVQDDFWSSALRI
jgi:GNAT superfamily N-acetyltransferase